MGDIKIFTIYGERCSGTNFIQKIMLDNFDIEHLQLWGWKHFFGHSDLSGTDDVLFIGIVRNPVQWMASLKKHPHHLPIGRNKRWGSFLLDEWVSIDEATGNEIIEDRNWKDKKKYKDIFELRKLKNEYLLDRMPEMVSNYVLIRYEDIKRNGREIIVDIGKNFSIKRKSSNIIITSSDETYGGTYIRKPKYKIPSRYMSAIRKRLDINQEKQLGYSI